MKAAHTTERPTAMIKQPIPLPDLERLRYPWLVLRKQRAAHLANAAWHVPQRATGWPKARGCPTTESAAISYLWPNTQADWNNLWLVLSHAHEANDRRCSKSPVTTRVKDFRWLYRATATQFTATPGICTFPPS